MLLDVVVSRESKHLTGFEIWCFIYSHTFCLCVMIDRLKHQNRMKALLGGPSEEVVFTDQQLSWTGVQAGGA